MCEDYESFHQRTVKPVVGGQSSSSFVPSVIKTEGVSPSKSTETMAFIFKAHRGGTSLDGIGSELIKIFVRFLLQLVSFIVDNDPL